jgi:hypothetical protein
VFEGYWVFSNADTLHHMPDPIDPQAFLNLCDMSIDSMYELAAHETPQANA